MTNKQWTMRYTVVDGWPRWTRETILAMHAATDGYGVQRVLAPDEDLGTPLHTMACEQSSDTEGAEDHFTACLDRVDSECEAILLRNGVDATGRCHDGERLLLTRLPSPSAAATAGTPTDVPPILASDVDDTPTWLQVARQLVAEEQKEDVGDVQRDEGDGTEAGVVQENECEVDESGDVQQEEVDEDESCADVQEVVEESGDARQEGVDEGEGGDVQEAVMNEVSETPMEACAGHPMLGRDDDRDTAEESPSIHATLVTDPPADTPSPPTTRLVCDGDTVMEFAGWLPPPLLDHLASQQATLLTVDGAHVRIGKRGSSVRAGTYDVSLGKFHGNAYESTDAAASQVRTGRGRPGNVVALHRQRKQARERR